MLMDTLKQLQIIPGIGKRLSRDLVDLGYQNVNELKNENPDAMYQKLSKIRGRHIDRCVLYVFRCAVYFASNSIHEPKLLKWWNWKDSNES
jgi:hypothetical protein